MYCLLEQDRLLTRLLPFFSSMSSTHALREIQQKHFREWQRIEPMSRSVIFAALVLTALTILAAVCIVLAVLPMPAGPPRIKL